MDAAHGGMPGRLTCMLPFLNLTLIVVGFCHCWNNADASSLLCEPPYTEPYVRWCGRTAEVTPPPTRFVSCRAMKLIEAKELAVILRVNRQRVYELARRNVIPVVRIGNRQYRFD